MLETDLWRVAAPEENQRTNDSVGRDLVKDWKEIPKTFFGYWF